MQRGLKSRYFGDLTWLEIQEAIDNNALLIIPVGTTEQHGHHLPVDTDMRLASAIVCESVRLLPNSKYALYTQPVWAGYSQHHQGFPGLFTLTGNTFIQFLVEICLVAYEQGFKNIILINGHGGNASFIGAASRILNDMHDVKVASFSYWDFARAEISKWRDSDLGGINHACEMETSLILHLNEELVVKDKIKDSPGKARSEYYAADLAGGGIVGLPGKFKDSTETGVIGMPSLASAEKGKELFEIITEKISKFLQQYDLVKK